MTKTMTKTIILSTTLMALGSLTAGCDLADEPGDSPITRSFELSDDSGNNTVTVLVTAEHEAALDDFDIENLELIVDGDGSEGSWDLGPGAEDDAEDDAEAPPFQLEVIDEHLERGVDSILVQEIDPPTERASFSWRYAYSLLDCTDVTRHSVLHKVYVSIWSEPFPGAGWSSIVSGKKLSNGETVSRCANGSYRLKVGTNAKKTKHYTVEFNQ